MILTEAQTIELYHNRIKYESFDYKFRFTTKYKWYCLACLKPIYVSYQQYGKNAIFCDTCYPTYAPKPTLAQYHYMRILKQKQLKVIETQIYPEI